MSAAIAEIEQLARRLWGEPNPGHSTREELRFGTNGSKSVKLKDRTWFDHEADEGGCYIDLYEKVHGERPADASIVATYDYHDANGALLFQVVRKLPKKFLQRRPGSDAGWIWDMHGVERVPYRLPELLRAAPHAPIFICEGEKDCDNLRERSLIATTNPGGAGKWSAKYNVYFRGRRVVVLSDNDPQATMPDGTPRWHPDGRPVLPGQDHAADVARSLHGIAASVRVVMLPDLPPKGDVSDWLVAGGTAEELEILAAADERDEQTEQERQRDAAPEPPPQPGPGPTGPRILSAADFMAGFVPPDYIIDGILQRGRLYALTSPTGHGKTAVALYKGCMVAAGRNIGAIEVTQGPVVFLAGENPDDLRARLHAACQAYGLDPALLPLYVLPGNFLLTAEAAETLKREIDALACRPVLIVVDTAAAFFHGDNDNDNVQMGAFARQLRVLTTCQGKPAVLTPAHPVKNPDRDNLLPRGGGAFLNEIDGNLTLWAATMGETATLHWQGKIRGADFSPVSFALQQVKITGLTDRRGRPIVSIVATLQTDDQAETAARVARSDENTVLEWLRRHPGISIKDIALNSGWASPDGSPHKGKVHRLLKALKAEKLVTQHRGKWKMTDAGKKELESE